MLREISYLANAIFQAKDSESLHQAVAQESEQKAQDGTEEEEQRSVALLMGEKERPKKWYWISVRNPGANTVVELAACWPSCLTASAMNTAMEMAVLFGACEVLAAAAKESEL